MRRKDGSRVKGEILNGIMRRIKNILLNPWRNTAMRMWLAVTLIYSMFSVCPCCGQQTCPGSFGAATLLGGIVAFITVSLNKGKQLLVWLFRKRNKADRNY